MDLIHAIFSWLSAMQQFAFAVFMLGFSKLYNMTMHDRKRELFSRLKTMNRRQKQPIELLEIGAGTGANFSYYPRGCHVTCLDPNPHSLGFMRKGGSDIILRDPVIGYSESMTTIADSSMDAVVSTLVLCSVSDVDKSLSEIKRVLRKVCVVFLDLGEHLYMFHTFL